jgi:hypothetical protein
MDELLLALHNSEYDTIYLADGDYEVPYDYPDAINRPQVQKDARRVLLYHR